jgi:hypothetical protein
MSEAIFAGIDLHIIMPSPVDIFSSHFFFRWDSVGYYVVGLPVQIRENGYQDHLVDQFRGDPSWPGAFSFVTFGS